jgi:hypothetical protein
MLWRRTPTGGRLPADPPPEVLLVVVSRRGRTLRQVIRDSGVLTRTRVVAAGVVTVAAAAAVLAFVLPDGQHAASTSAANAARLSDPGPAGVAAAYRYPANCLSVAFAPADRSYARAQLDRASPCWRYGVWVTAVFHREDGVWHQVLNAHSYSCPVPSLPGLVARQLGVCTASRAP